MLQVALVQVRDGPIEDCISVCLIEFLEDLSKDLDSLAVLLNLNLLSTLVDQICYTLLLRHLFLFGEILDHLLMPGRDLWIVIGSQISHRLSIERFSILAYVFEVSLVAHCYAVFLCEHEALLAVIDQVLILRLVQAAIPLFWRYHPTCTQVVRRFARRPLDLLGRVVTFDLVARMVRLCMLLLL